MIIDGAKESLLSIFTAYKEPPITLLDYLLRINTYSRCSSSSFVLSLIYIDRLIERDGFVLTRENIHRLVITAVMVAAKFIDDFHYNNSTFAKIGGISTNELNGLELDFLARLRYSLHATTVEFETYGAALQEHVFSDMDNIEETSSVSLEYTESTPKSCGYEIAPFFNTCADGKKLRRSSGQVLCSSSTCILTAG